MNRTYPMAIIATVAIIASASLVPPAMAYSSEVVEEYGISTFIRMFIEDSGDVKNYTAIVTDSSKDDNVYTLVPDMNNSEGYPSVTVTSEKKPTVDSNVVEKNERFNFDIVIPAGVSYCVKVTMASLTAANNITVTSPDFTGKLNYTSSSSASVFIGEQDGKLRAWGNLGDEVWICSDKDTTIHLEGSRGSTLGLNWGAMHVKVLMKETA